MFDFSYSYRVKFQCCSESDISCKTLQQYNGLPFKDNLEAAFCTEMRQTWHDRTLDINYH